MSDWETRDWSLFEEWLQKRLGLFRHNDLDEEIGFEKGASEARDKILDIAKAIASEGNDRDELFFEKLRARCE